MWNFSPTYCLAVPVLNSQNLACAFEGIGVFPTTFVVGSPGDHNFLAALPVQGINTIVQRSTDVVDFGLGLTAVSTVAVLVGVIVGIRELRHFSKVRQADVIRSISDKVANPEFVKNFLLLAKMNNQTYEEIEGKPEEVAMITWLTYMEGLAIAVKRGIVPLDVVDDYWHGAIRTVWEKCEPIVRTYREKYHHPEMGEWVEYLYLRIYGKSETERSRVADLEKRIYSKRVQ